MLCCGASVHCCGRSNLVNRCNLHGSAERSENSAHGLQNLPIMLINLNLCLEVTSGRISNNLRERLKNSGLSTYM